MIQVDCRLHSTFSMDGGASIPRMAEAAAQAGLRQVGFAEL